MIFCDMCEMQTWELLGHEPECGKCDYFKKSILPEIEKEEEAIESYTENLFERLTARNNVEYCEESERYELWEDLCEKCNEEDCMHCPY